MCSRCVTNNESYLVGLGCFGLLIWLAVILVAIHFISKFW